MNINHHYGKKTEVLQVGLNIRWSMIRIQSEKQEIAKKETKKEENAIPTIKGPKRTSN